MNVRDIKGRPKFESGQFLGYVLWKRSDGFHLRWTTKGRKAHNFQGKIVYQTKLGVTGKITSKTGFKIYETDDKMIHWNSSEEGKVSGIDFISPGNFTLELKIDKKKIKPKAIFLGPEMKNPESNPFTIIQIFEEKISQKEIKKILEKKIKEPLREIETKAIYEYIPEVEPVYEPTLEPEPVYEPTPEPEPEPVYEPTLEPEPVYEPTPEPELEPVY
ncbi:MAG: hypothetical protein ACFFB6_11000, partial [Promethearchaeota archaeon]